MIKAIVTDIEGTTSSLSFVRDILFPYARQHLADYLVQHQQDELVKSILSDAQRLLNQVMDLPELTQQFIQWLDQDQKITPLKSLQGLIWENGYQRGDFKGHIYEDAARCLQAFKHQGCKLYIYSSGSVAAQKLLFGNTEFGDLTVLFSGYFDTHIGGKKEPNSYARIAEQIQLPPEEILFLSDIQEELDAAHAIGYRTYWLVRDGAINPLASHQQIASFDAITL